MLPLRLDSNEYPIVAVAEPGRGVAVVFAVVDIEPAGVFEQVMVTAFHVRVCIPHLGRHLRTQNFPPK